MDNNKNNEETDITEILKEAVSNPASVSVDSQTVSQHNLKDLIEFDRYLASKNTSRGKSLGIRLFKVKLGGANE